MTFQINDLILSKECASIAQSILDDMVRDNRGEFDADQFREDAYDRVFEFVDSHEFVIYNYKALKLCADCDTSDGEDFMDDIGFEWTNESTIYSVASQIAFNEMRARVDTALQELLDSWEEEQNDKDERRANAF